MKRFNDKGQSLVEVALFMPIFIFILAGVVEVGNLMNTQNRVTTASRVAAGFGASNFNRNDWANTADAMGDVALNTVTETLDLSADLWDIWSIHAITNEDGTGFDVFTHEKSVLRKPTKPDPSILYPPYSPCPGRTIHPGGPEP